MAESDHSEDGDELKGWWGARVESDGKPVPFVPPPLEAKLHLSQVCMGPGTEAGARAYLRCKVQDGPPLVIASLREGHCENVSLDLVYDEYTEFSVEGNAPLHISGYMMYMEDGEEGPDGYGGGGFGGEDDSDDEEPYSPEEVAALRKMLKQQRSGGSGESDEDEDSESDDEAVPQLVDMEADSDDASEEDGEDSGEFETDSDEEAPESTVTIEELPADMPDPVEAAMQKRKADAAAMEKPQSAKKQKQQQQQGEKQKQQEQRAAAAAAQEAKAQAASAQKAAAAADKAATAAAKAEQKAEKKAAGKDASTPAAKPPGTGDKATAKQQKAAQTASTSASADTLLNGAATPKSGKKGVRKFPNGLEIHDVAMGQPDGKLAKAGKRVKMRYVGRLASNSKVFDQTKGNKTFSFRLGVGEVISGWDKGIEGMRVGDKRRLIIPPSMGYGASGAPPDIPGNAKLIFDVELVNVM